MNTQNQHQGPATVPTLTSAGRKAVEQLAGSHPFSSDAVIAMLAALHRGNGRQAQFNHPELGGMGQWSSGGMIMIGDMFNNALKAKVTALAQDAAAQMAGAALFETEDTGVDGQDTGAAPRWPADLGTPAATGSQNSTHYAFFPDKQRLAITSGEVTALYDTGDHRILGFAQQQGGDAAMRFTSQHGTVALDSLTRVDPAEAPRPSSAGDRSPEAETPPEAAEPDTSEHAIIAKIEGIARLHAKGVLSDAEFAAKKAELLARL